MSLTDLQHDLNQLAEQQLEGAKECRDLRSICLDHRSAPVLWIGSDFIAVAKRNEGTLRYYGGFECVEDSNRTECGEYVFYSTDSDIVLEHHEHFESNGE